jgi:hypothetical protein
MGVGTSSEENKSETDFNKVTLTIDDTYNRILNEYSDTLNFDAFDALPSEYNKLKEQTYNSLATIIRGNQPTDVQSVLMYNHLHFPQKEPYIVLPDYMTGPVSITILRDNENDRTFYLFGDIHTKNREPSSNYFHRLVPNHLGQLDKVVDVFFESGFHIHKKYGFPIKMTTQEELNRLYGKANNYLEEFALYLRNCEPEYIDEGRCQYGNVRVHVSDARDAEPFFNPLFIGNTMEFRNPKCTSESAGGFMGCIMKLFINLNQIYDLDAQTCRRILAYTRQLFNQYKKVEIDDRGLLFRELILKQIAMIPEQDLANKLEEYTNKIVDDLYKDIDQIYRLDRIPTYIHQIKNPQEAFDRIFNRRRATNLMDTAAKILDVYFIARCYRKFNVRKDRVFPAVPCKNIVAYFGDFHIDNIVNLLTNKLKQLKIIYRFDPKSIGETYYNPDYSPLQIPWFGKNILKKCGSCMEVEEKKDSMEVEDEI